jgi:hypothetical protein
MSPPALLGLCPGPPSPRALLAARLATTAAAAGHATCDRRLLRDGITSKPSVAAAGDRSGANRVKEAAARRLFGRRFNRTPVA